MAVSIVNAFEVVGVNHQNAVVFAGGFGTENPVKDLFFKITAVVQRGQRIADCLVFQQHFAIFAAGDILKAAYNATSLL